MPRIKKVTQLIEQHIRQMSTEDKVEILQALVEDLNIVVLPSTAEDNPSAKVLEPGIIGTISKDFASYLIRTLSLPKDQDVIILDLS